MKNCLVLLACCAVLLAVFSAAVPAGYEGIRVKGNKILANDGEEIVLRGVNKMFVWTDKNGLTMGEIAKTRANCVRIVWTMKDGTPEELEALIEMAAGFGMIPMIEVHDKTCKWDDAVFEDITAYWTSPAMVEIIRKHENYLLLNYGNEIGDWKTTVSDYNERYIKAVKKLRKAGIRVPIVIDAGKCGQDINNYYASAPEILKNDPMQNIILSVHMWWTDNDPVRIQDAISAVSYTDAPLIVGEFASKGMGCASDIAYRAIIEECEKNKIGWLAWSWGPGNQDCSEMDMTKDGKFDTLYGWGKEVAVESAYSIKNTSVKPSFMNKYIKD